MIMHHLFVQLRGPCSVRGMVPWASCDTEENTQKNIRGVDLFAVALRS